MSPAIGQHRPDAAAVAVASALLIGGCGLSVEDDEENAGGTAGDAATELTVATSFAIDTLLPLDDGFWAPEFGYSDLLMRPLPGGELEPWVLESLEPVDDTTWELTLREGVTFQNGNPLDAEVLAELMTWHIAENPAVTTPLDGAEATVTGPSTVELTTPEPVPNVPSILAHEGSFVLFDLATYQELEDSPEDLVGAGIYTGPYSVVGLTSEAMLLEPTEDYYGDDPALSEVTVQFVPDARARVRAVESGEADLALYPPTAAARQLDDSDDAVYLVEPAGEATGGMQLFVNREASALAEAEVRRALQLAVDYGSLADEALEGLYDRSAGMFPAFLPYARGSVGTDPDEAERLLDDAGWRRDGDDGVRRRDGEDLTVRLLTYPQQPDVGVAAVALQSQLDGVGIDVEISEVDDINEAMRGDDWELGISNNSSLGMTGTDPIQPLTTYYHSEGERNFGGIDDPDLDALIEELAVTVDPEEQEPLLEEIQQIVVTEGAYGWYLSFKRTPVVTSPELADYTVPVANLWMTHFGA